MIPSLNVTSDAPSGFSRESLEVTAYYLQHAGLIGEEIPELHGFDACEAIGKPAAGPHEGFNAGCVCAVERRK
jgi:hypothetical protein